jgi:endonuclease/exonuclease/phosphatase family metal-dependent hydrolase
MVAMRVLSWNLWWRFGPWQRRQPAIATEFDLIDADLSCLQEVWCDADDGDQAEHLAARRGLHVARSTGSDGRPFGFGNAILSRWPILESDTLVLPGIDGKPSHRSAVVAVVAGPQGAQLVASTHLAWQYEQSQLRQHQLAFLVPVLDRQHRQIGNDLPMILAGDFNAVPESDEIRRLTGLAPGYGPPLVFTDAWAATNAEPGFTWDRSNPHSRDAQWPRRRLDYVFVSWPRPKPTGNPLSARLAGRDPHAGVVPSDHSAVVVELDDRRPEDLTPPS